MPPLKTSFLWRVRRPHVLQNLDDCRIAIFVVVVCLPRRVGVHLDMVRRLSLRLSSPLVGLFFPLKKFHELPSERGVMLNLLRNR